MSLLNEAKFRELLGGLGERRFKELRAAGIVGAPLELGPRAARWTHADFLETLSKLQRRQTSPEPASLGAGRRARIEAMKRFPHGGLTDSSGACAETGAAVGQRS